MKKLTLTIIAAAMWLSMAAQEQYKVKKKADERPAKMDLSS